MVLKNDAQVTTDIRQCCRGETPRLPSEFDCALEAVSGPRHARRMAAMIEDRAIEAGIVGGDELHILKKWCYSGPYLAESRRVRHVLPRYAVDPCKQELLTWRADEEVLLLDDFGPVNDDNSEGTNAVTTMIGGLEVDSGEPPGWARCETHAR